MARKREQRHFVLMRGSLRIGLRRADVCIRNISTHGMMVQMTSPPAPGSYVEISGDNFSVVGRVVWAGGHKCGIRTREAIDLAALLGADPAPAADRARRVAAVALGRADSARLVGRAIDFSVVGLLAAALTAAAATAMYQTLAEPLTIVQRSLG